ncbi:MAG: sulfotransferase domain-containing protein [Candidatus Binatia bacterium]
MKPYIDPKRLSPALKMLVKAPRALTANLRLLPDFIIIGAQRCGTTSLHRYLTEHPCIAPAFRKEVHFFDKNFPKGPAWYREHFPSRLYKHYLKKVHGREMITGEASVYYMFHPLPAERVAQLLPRVKLIALLRNPVDRAYSHYHHEARKGRETLPFEEAVEKEQERLGGEREKILASDGKYESFPYRRYSYLARGAYAEQLQQWLRWFPVEQILLLRSEDFNRDPATVLAHTLRFLGVPDDWRPQDYPKYNSAAYSPMAPATRNRLRAYFAPHNHRLQELTGRNFGWDQ